MTADSRTGDLGTLRTGVPDLDRVLGGGLAVPSLTPVAGPPGSDRTTLLHQVMFASAGPGRPALHEVGSALERRTDASKTPLYRATSRPFGGGNGGAS